MHCSTGVFPRRNDTTKMGQTVNKKRDRDLVYPFHELENIFETDLAELGLILNDIYIPEEILVLILSYVDKESIDNHCRLVCKNWYNIIREVWKLKAEREYPKLFSAHHKRFPWSVYRSTVFKNCYGRNLIKNHNGLLKFQHWEIEHDGGDRWTTESPPIGVPVNNSDSEFPSAFVTSYTLCVKKQTIDLLQEGVSPYILDFYQPDIIVSEWIAARWDCGSVYGMEVWLLNEDKEKITKFEIKKELRNWIHGWEEVKHTFKSYGPGVRYIIFQHSGKDLQFWAGHYGSKMTNASITIPLTGIGEIKWDSQK